MPASVGAICSPSDAVSSTRTAAVAESAGQRRDVRFAEVSLPPRNPLVIRE
jgi:hypothetical protein